MNPLSNGNMITVRLDDLPADLRCKLLSYQTSHSNGTTTTQALSPYTAKDTTKKIVASLAKGVFDGLAVFGFGCASLLVNKHFFQMNSYQNNETLFMLVLCTALGTVSVNAYRKYKEKISIDASSLQTTSKQSGFVSLVKGIGSGIKYASVAISLELLTIMAIDTLTNSYIGPEVIPTMLATAGTAGLAKTIYDFRQIGSSLKEWWKSASKVKKLGVSAMALLASAVLGTLYIGPAKVEQYIHQKAHQAYDLAASKVHQLLYTTSTQTNTKMYGEIIRGYSTMEEMERLAALPPEASCAEVLFTCDIPLSAINRGNILNKEFKVKQRLFHPDKNPNHKDLAAKASISINNAKEVFKKKKECPGQENYCDFVDNEEILITKSLIKPRWLTQKLSYLKPACLLTIDGKTIQASTLDPCKDLI